MDNAGRNGWTATFARLSTSQKLILLLTLALAPLGAVAMIVSVQSALSADAQRRGDAQVAATEAARKLSAELTSDVLALRAAATAMDTSADSREPCARLNALLAANPARRVPAALFGPSSAPLCASPSIGTTRPSVRLFNDGLIVRRAGDALEMIVTTAGGTNVAMARYSPATLARFAQPTGFTLPYRLSLDTDGYMIDLVDTADGRKIRRAETATIPVGIADLAISLTVSAAPFGAPEAFLAFLPLLMWAAAVGVGYYVVDRFLVRPLKELRAAVASYEPGSARHILSTTPATEIRELETSFTAFADRLAERERDVESALADQVKLTREVHHRVKNNLQVIASLISLHARGTMTADAQNAYVTIQRRVDALAIVHRNHYAELEKNLGIDIKALLGELVANFRANAGQNIVPPVVTVAAAALTVSQDTATPLAFLFTEITEMALLSNAAAPIAIAVTKSEAPDRADMAMTSTSLAGRKTPDGHPSLRIIEALARQLRSTLDYDPAIGRYLVGFPVISPVKDE